MLALHTSAYRAKNPSNSSGCTTVLSFTFSGFLVVLSDFVLCPSDARMIIGRGLGGFKSQRGSSATFAGGVGASSVEKVRRFWVRWMEPWPRRWVDSMRVVRLVKNWGMH